mmetsp:Transcript_30628/g.45324  ORF Transcript_30628/g.45324 Transcript_30628/m.45324 type:complete len:143 (-) Transcript_30628:312-740(-)
MSNPQKAEDEAALLEANQKMLNSIVSTDYDVYKSLCSEDITCFEPESKYMLAHGRNFHKYYFDLAEYETKKKEEEEPLPATVVTMSSPHIRWIGNDAAVLSYVRLDQKYRNGVPETVTSSETRIWERQADGENWICVHFHKS